MKYHRWKPIEGMDRVECVHCGVSVHKQAKPRRVTACPPTLFEKMIMDTFYYGRLPTVDYGELKFPLSAVLIAKKCEFDGLHCYKSR